MTKSTKKFFVQVIVKLLYKPVQFVHEKKRKGILETLFIKNILYKITIVRSVLRITGK